MRQALSDVDTMPRDEWLVAFPNQIILTVEQLIWARDIHTILDDPDNKPIDRMEGLKAFEQQSFEVNFFCTKNCIF